MHENIDLVLALPIKPTMRPGSHPRFSLRLRLWNSRHRSQHVHDIYSSAIERELTPFLKNVNSAKGNDGGAAPFEVSGRSRQRFAKVLEKLRELEHVTDSRFRLGSYHG